MSIYFVDTSVLAKRYIKETGSAWVISWVEPIPGNTIIIADISSVEMFSLFSRRVREGTLAAADAILLENDFLFHLATEHETLQCDVSVLTRARTFTKTYALRTLDALQLASAAGALAIVNKPITLISGDNRLLTAAASEGFAVDNPNNYP